MEEDYKSFEYQALMAHKDRCVEDSYKKYDLDYVAQLEYSKFCVWCNCEKAIIIQGTKAEIDREKMKREVYINPKIFKEYLKVESFDSVLPDWLIKRKIAEKYFGYEYFKNDKGEWRAKKKS